MSSIICSEIEARVALTLIKLVTDINSKVSTLPCLLFSHSHSCQLRISYPMLDSLFFTLKSEMEARVPPHPCQVSGWQQPLFSKTGGSAVRILVKVKVKNFCEELLTKLKQMYTTEWEGPAGLKRLLIGYSKLRLRRWTSQLFSLGVFRIKCSLKSEQGNKQDPRLPEANQMYVVKAKRDKLTQFLLWTV